MASTPPVEPPVEEPDDLPDDESGNHGPRPPQKP